MKTYHCVCKEKITNFLTILNLDDEVTNLVMLTKSVQRKVMHIHRKFHKLIIFMITTKMYGYML